MVPPSSQTKGPKDSNIYLVEFSDFQCSACKTAKPAVDEALKKYEDKVLFVYRHFPLSQHKFAQKTAEFAEAAGEQGKFWETYDYLFENQEKFSDDFFKNIAKDLGLDETRFEESLKSKKLKDKIKKDQADGIRLGVNSTPSFFLNGKKLILYDFGDIEKEIQKLTS